MATSRYSFTPIIRAGKQYATSMSSVKIRKAIEAGTLEYSIHITSEGQRLDGLAGRFYGDGSLWWVLAAASGIGWGLQVPAGTMIYVPSNIGYIYGLVR
tara:strand:+ start:4113 stop:4409 length:297 start_codon:yes stop_codon:yes gene_type:complete